MKIRHKNLDPFELEVKRLYHPYVFVDTCPKCGKEVENDNYLSHPMANGQNSIDFCHTTDDPDDMFHEWSQDYELVFEIKPLDRCKSCDSQCVDEELDVTGICDTCNDKGFEEAED